MSKFTYRSMAASLLALLVLVGCGGGYGGGGNYGMVGGGGGAINMINVTPTTATVSVGGTQQFTAVAKDGSGNTVNGAILTWASSNTSVATVNSNGLVTAVAVGSAGITASITYSGGVYGAGNTITSNSAMLTVTTMISGTAATGAALAHAQVSLRDATGQFALADADATGRFSIDVRGLTAPFLLKAEDAQGHVLFGAAAGVGQANVTPYSDLLVHQWYAEHGGDAAQAFARPGSALPEAKGLAALDHDLVETLKSPLAAVGLDAGKFSFLKTPFAADHSGFDALLDKSSIDAATGRIDVSEGGRSNRYWLDPEHRRKLWHGDQNTQAGGPEELGGR